jgi:predicted DNA binding CopG/RHH family protein
MKGKEMQSKIITCECCGKPFERKNNKQKYCGFDCKHKMERQMQKEYQKKYYASHPYEPKPKPKKKKSAEEDLDQIKAEAFEAGMSYGKYVAMKEYGMVIERRGKGNE